MWGYYLITLGLISIFVYVFFIYKNEINKLKKEVEENKINFNYPKYVKLQTNLNVRVYKIKSILVTENHPYTDPRLVLLLTCEDKDGNAYNATSDKFVKATEKEYLKNKKEELDY
jgi:K+ transporter